MPPARPRRSARGPLSYRPEPGSIPTQPGVYRFRDAHGRVIYVGKAKNLRARLSSYFQDVANLHQRTASMVTTAAGVEWTVVNTEVEALQLEYSWIKEFDPRFNVKYRDDKSYPWLAVTVGDEFPRVMVGRGAKRRGTRYFGPYSHAWAIRETVDILLRVFPMRSCSNGVFKRSAQIGRPCLLGYIDKCSAPCVGAVSPEEHRRIVDDFCEFMAGRTRPFTRRIEQQMYAASEALDFEKAARLRDDLGAMERALEKQAVVLGDGADADVIALAEDPLEVAVQIFYVRGGRIRGQRGWVADRVDEGGTAELVEDFLLQLYAGTDQQEGDSIPREILVPTLPPDVETFEQLLGDLRGSRVVIRVPQRGDKRTLQETVARNAGQALVLHKTRRASDLTTRNRALEEIQSALELDEVPLRIECYDVSNLQGTEVVASMVVFEDGLPRKGEYRRFVVKGVDGQDDVAWMHEVITRRFRRLLDEQARSVPAPHPDGSSGTGQPEGPMLVDPETGRPRKFAYAPGLVVVDGGAPQVAAAQRALDALGVDDIPVCGLAKRLEEVWRPGEEDPVILARSSEGLYLLQRIRDEAHRFAITHHRNRRSKSMVESVLDDIPGLGEVRRKTLLKHFGSLKKLRAAEVDQIALVPGIGPRTAAAIKESVARAAPGGQDGRCGSLRQHRHRRDRGRMSTGPRGVPDQAGELVVVTGMTGAGRSTVAKELEDLGFYVVDNLPPGLLPDVVRLVDQNLGTTQPIAVVVDVRSGSFFTALRAQLAQGAHGRTATLVFLDASDEVLVRRQEAARRPHPLQGSGRLLDGLHRERLAVAELRGDAALVIDTSMLNVHQLTHRISEAFGTPQTLRLKVTVISFGFKYGIPVDADYVADMRFLPNPFWVPELRASTGRDAPVAAYVTSRPGAAEFLDAYVPLLDSVAAGYLREGKRFMRVAVGCTGGKHRSVAMSEEITARLGGLGHDARVVHRDLGRE